MWEKLPRVAVVDGTLYVLSYDGRTRCWRKSEHSVNALSSEDLAQLFGIEMEA